LNGLINEYIEKTIILNHDKIIEKESMSEIERIIFPDPFNEMEAFYTSGGCSTLPYTFRNKIDFLDYKTIRYTGHCKKFKFLFDLGFGSNNPIIIRDKKIIPRDILICFLEKNLPRNEKDVVLVKVISEGLKDGEKMKLEYTLIDFYDEENDITAMMRTTGYPVSIIAQMIENRTINQNGVFCPEEIVPCKPFFYELQKRGIKINMEFI
jgi:lysine 6-dehydrogenase